MFNLRDARNILSRWLHGGDSEASAAHSASSPGEKPLSAADEREKLIKAFINELQANSQDWLGRVRLINFEAIRERVGLTWPKLQPKVELMAEKIIREEISDRDRYLNIGNAEFLIFIADATPEEVRIRCFGIVEAIHQKFFGIDGDLSANFQRIAESHVAQLEDVLSWGGALSSVPEGQSDRSRLEQVRGLFRRDAERLELDDLTESAQFVIDQMIAQATKSLSLNELSSLLNRLKHLARGLAFLEPALGEKKNGAPSHQQLEKGGPPGGDFDGAATMSLRDVREDADRLLDALDGSVNSHSDVLRALKDLRRARAERIEKDAAEQAYQGVAESIQIGEFRYWPVYRSLSQGAQIYQGIFQIGSQPLGSEADASVDGSGITSPETASTERALLIHAVQYLTESSSSERFVIMASVHVEALHGPMTQMSYSTILRGAALRAKRRIVVDVAGYRESDNTLAVRRGIDELRAHSHAVFVTISRESVGRLHDIAAENKKFGVHAIGLDMIQFEGAEMDAIRQLAEVSKRLAIPTLVKSIPSMPILAKAVAMGITYLHAPRLSDPYPSPRPARRITFDHLH